jgi:hypothetical protein
MAYDSLRPTFVSSSHSAVVITSPDWPGSVGRPATRPEFSQIQAIHIQSRLLDGKLGIAQ